MLLMASSMLMKFTHVSSVKLCICCMCVCVFGSASLRCLTLFHAVMIHDTLNYTLYYCPLHCQDFKGIKMRGEERGA